MHPNPLFKKTTIFSVCLQVIKMKPKKITNPNWEKISFLMRFGIDKILGVLSLMRQRGRKKDGVQKREKGTKSRVTNSGSGWDDVSWGEGLALSFWLQRREEDITRNTIQKILNPTKHWYDKTRKGCQVKN